MSGRGSAAIRTLLVANRGEIACRIFRTGRALGLTCAAVYAPPDADARHVREADVAVALHGESVATTYLDVDQVVAAAVRLGADAVHPGYGFLAENADAAEAVVAAGLVWVGPRPETVRLMGSKLSAKAAAAAAGVPLPASAEVTGDDAARWAEAAEGVGFPLLVKASAGGGGKGMRLVETVDDLTAAVEAARREAASAFGDPTVFLERRLVDARHVEVQVFGDRHGHVVHLGERECSIQRRHQKVVEESPSPGVTERTRAVLHESAVALSRSVGYVGAGTVEFLVEGRDEDQRVAFLEMNTRLQVEHPVTEAVTGLDLVALQLRVAEGHPLGIDQADVVVRGHAIEARVYAEDPASGHLPDTGRLAAWRPDPSIRWDCGVGTDDRVGTSYDPMLAKAVAHGTDRRHAARVLARTLGASAIHGLRTNLASLRAVVDSEPFLDGDTTTDFLDRHPEVLDPRPPPEVSTAHLLAAVAHERVRRHAALPTAAIAPARWRNVPAPARPAQWVARVDGTEHLVTCAPATGGAKGFTVDVDGRTYAIEVGSVAPDGTTLVVDGTRVLSIVTRDADRRIWVTAQGWTTTWSERARHGTAVADRAGTDPVAPVPGTVSGVLVAPGDTVEVGTVLVRLEAMKMEHPIVAPAAGRVVDVLVEVGQGVEAHEVLVRLESEDGGS